MNRFLGLDVGDKYIGVSISDTTCTIASNLVTIRRTSNDKAYEEIEGILNDYNIGTVVVGVPINMDGSDTVMSKRIRKFARKLTPKFGVEVIFQDERFTSIEAERTLIQSNVRRENRKKYIDQLAASIILQTYIDRMNNDND
ncbi:MULTISPECIES: Holliday junction resolvase RuvX [Peptoniphilus]|uniref:Putative pre-16S rRNA nuclease n=1 Tax=Peptoniphilus duerdenii ATCC BAA-1640 TaxID=862517 RepID=E0NNK7_9FIRM|nr:MULTISPECIES: Holliday junction resolvase RuvX [Peptoniphilus]EFM24610.1 RNAse H domain protein, YqgF family [Peptoniphilus duerdenii ATCC BAA-1640]ERT64897.1 RNAse H domain protein, YqgF family [Peptoniphilus sp. BV3AC2]MDK8275737.1 Holliday junction resolvase RuvX [Peptoniphilus duerdenii]